MSQPLSAAHGTRVAVLIVSCLVAHAVTVSPTFAALGPTDSELDQIGVTDLNNRLGAAAPTGAGIAVSHVEAGGYVSEDGSTFEYAYTPEASQPFFVGRNFTLKSGPGISTNHATNMGAHWYGDNGIAPGVTEIDVYSAELYWGDDLLQNGSKLLPSIETQRVQNHSWIIPSGGASTSYTTDILRRFDYMLDRDGVVAAVGINNRSDSLFPLALANSYNSIAVGRSNGNSSLGPTTLDTPGRTKPDLVAPARNTSTASSWVSSAATLLLETAGSDAGAARPETIKATLLAGATKGEFDLTGATPDTFDDWSHTPDRPLDLRFGAGELNIDNAHRILTAGEKRVGVYDNGTTGWDYDNINAGASQLYFFDVHPNATIESLSIAATWHRKFDVDTEGTSAIFDPLLANIDLRLYEVDDLSLVSVIDSSVSTVDNVEHIYREGLAGGRYAIEVVSDKKWDFALAWHTILEPTAPGDANYDGLVDGLDYLIWAEHYGESGATASDGDFDGNGTIDGHDLLVWGGYFGEGGEAIPGAGGTAIPEPSSALLALLGSLAFALTGRRRRCLAMQR
jgi:hypothetical protein